MTLDYVLGEAQPPPLRLNTPADWEEFRRRYIFDQSMLRLFIRKLWKLYGDRLTALENPVGSSTVYSGTVDIDFGSTVSFEASATVTAAWVAAGTEIVFSPNSIATADHTAEETLVEDLEAAVTSITPATSFVVTAIAPSGTTGIHKFSYIGV